MSKGKILVIETERFYYELKNKHDAWDYGTDFDCETDQDEISLMPVKLILDYEKNKREFERIQEQISKYYKKG